MVTGPLNFCAPVVISSAFSRKLETLAVLCADTTYIVFEAGSITGVDVAPWYG
jgi:hypothetical protein